MVEGLLSVTASASFLPSGVHSASATWSEEVHRREPVELLEIIGPTLALEGLKHDQVLAMLEGRVLDVLNRLEEGGGFSLHLSLLFCLAPG